MLDAPTDSANAWAKEEFPLQTEGNLSAEIQKTWERVWIAINGLTLVILPVCHSFNSSHQPSPMQLPNHYLNQQDGGENWKTIIQKTGVLT